MGSDLSLLNLRNNTQNYFAIQMSGFGKLRLILASQDIVENTQKVLNRTYRHHVSHRIDGLVEFEIFECPWDSYTGEDKLYVNYFLCELMKAYYEIGWGLKTASHLKRSQSNTSVLIFNKQEPMPTSIMCLSLNSSDCIRVIGSENCCSIIKNTINYSWFKGIFSEKEFGKGYEFRLNGNLWSNWNEDSSDSFNTPKLVCDILENLFKKDWIYIGSLNSNRQEDRLNSLFFRYSPNQINQRDKNNTRFFCLSLNRSDRIRLHKPTSDLISILTNFDYGIPNLWSEGIQEEDLNNDTFQIKLNRNPWSSIGPEAVNSRRLMNNLFNLLSQYGWYLYASSNLSKNESKLSTFFFRSKPIEPKRLINFCISLNETDLIRVIEADDQVVEDVEKAINKSWSKGIQEKSVYNGSIQFKLNGNPFDSHGVDFINTCIMMIFILDNLEKRGFKLLTSACLSTKHSHNQFSSYLHSKYLHSWFFEN